MSQISVVIVNWNGKKDTLNCLASLEKVDKDDSTLSVIVVDNGSTDSSVKEIGRDFPAVTLIKAKTNLGFTGGNNLGIKRALSDGADCVWLLNNDTLVDAQALSLVQAFSDHQVGIAGSKIYFAPGREYHRSRYRREQRGKVLWYAGGVIDWANMYASHRGVDEVDTGQYETVAETAFVTGCSMLIKRAVFERVGLLDERYYLYLEDLDFCLRAHRDGYKLVYFPRSKVWHVNAGSSGGPGSSLHDYYLTRNRLFAGMKYAPFRTRLALMREATLMVFGKSAVKRQAVMDALLGRWGRQYEPKADN